MSTVSAHKSTHPCDSTTSPTHATEGDWPVVECCTGKCGPAKGGKGRNRGEMVVRSPSTGWLVSFTKVFDSFNSTLHLDPKDVGRARTTGVMRETSYQTTRSFEPQPLPSKRGCYLHSLSVMATARVSNGHFAQERQARSMAFLCSLPASENLRPFSERGGYPGHGYSSFMRLRRGCGIFA